MTSFASVMNNLSIKTTEIVDPMHRQSPKKLMHISLDSPAEVLNMNNSTRNLKMKKLLIATTALVATAGMASADITISGHAAAGVYSGLRQLKTASAAAYQAACYTCTWCCCSQQQLLLKQLTAH